MILPSPLTRKGSCGVILVGIVEREKEDAPFARRSSVDFHSMYSMYLDGSERKVQTQITVIQVIVYILHMLKIMGIC